MDEQYIMIDSRKRDLSVFPNANAFSLYIMNPIKDIVKVDVVFCTMNLVTNTNIYGVLDIEQFRTKFGMNDGKANLLSNFQISGNISGTGWIGVLNPGVTPLANTNDYLPIPNQQGYDILNMMACMPIQNQLNMIYQERANYRQTVMFQQPIESLNKLNIRWIDRLNNLIAFGPNENQTLLRVYTIRKPPPTHREPELPDPVQKTVRNPEVVLIGLILVIVFILTVF